MAKRHTNCCLVPKPIDAKERALWAKIHTIKCSRKRESHQCRGTITIDAKAVTLNCPVCGDARSLLHTEDGK